MLAHAHEIAQTAVDRAAAADRRATTIAGTVSIAATVTLSGASLVFDDKKIKGDDWRGVLAFLLFAATAAFVVYRARLRRRPTSSATARALAGTLFLYALAY